MAKNEASVEEDVRLNGQEAGLLPRRGWVTPGRFTLQDIVWPSELQPTPPERQLRLLLCCRDCPLADRVQTYARRLSNLLGGELCCLTEDDDVSASFNEIAEVARQGCDLVILGEPEQPLLKQLFSGSLCRKVAERLPQSVLIVRDPRWPLRRILLVTRSRAIDEAGVAWTLRLAEPAGAQVRLLAITPSLPPICSEAIHRMDKIIDWRSTDTPLGAQARRLTEKLGGAYGDLIHFRSGTPAWQIRSELKEGQYDLVVIAADPGDWWSRRLVGELVEPVLDWAEQPILVARVLPP